MSLKCEWTAAESFSVLEGINFSQLGKNLVRPMAKKAIKWRDFHLSILSIFFAHGTLKFISLQLYWLSTDDSFHVRQFPRSRPALYTISTKGLFKAICLFLFVSSRTENYLTEKSTPILTSRLQNQAGNGNWKKKSQP